MYIEIIVYIHFINWSALSTVNNNCTASTHEFLTCTSVKLMVKQKRIFLLFLLWESAVYADNWLNSGSGNSIAIKSKSSAVKYLKFCGM